MALPKQLLNAKICNEDTCSVVKELRKDNVVVLKDLISVLDTNSPFVLFLQTEDAHIHMGRFYSDSICLEPFLNFTIVSFGIEDEMLEIIIKG